MSTVKLLFRLMRAEARADALQYALQQVAHHVGGDHEKPETVVVAAESLRAALSLAKGYQDIPRHPDGDPRPFEQVGR